MNTIINKRAMNFLLYMFVFKGLWLVSVIAHAQTRVFYYPSAGQDAVEITQNTQQFCRDNHVGLDLARLSLGIRPCQSYDGSGTGNSSLQQRLDVLILVNDLQGLGNHASALITGSSQVRRASSGEAYLIPAIYYARNSNGSFTGRVMVIGEYEYRQSYTRQNQQWVQRIQRLVREFEPGNLEGFSDGQYDMWVKFNPNYQDFENNVHRCLCHTNRQYCWVQRDTAAREFRGMVCRSDGGNRIRELIHRHRDLSNIHDGLRRSGVSNNEVTWIKLILTRQTSDVSEGSLNRIADIRFAIATNNIDFDDGSVIQSDRTPIVRQHMQEALQRANRLVNQIQNENKRDRLQCLLRVLQAAGIDSYNSPREPFGLNPLYTRLALQNADNWEGLRHIPPEESMRRIYPIRELYLYQQSYPRDDSRFVAALETMHDNLHYTYMRFAACEAIENADASCLLGRNQERLEMWVAEQQRTRGSVYSCWVESPREAN